jgi:hypothetical protein
MRIISYIRIHKSPSAYRFMRHTFRLPSESTLISYISGFAVTTGFDSDYMLALQKRAQSLSDNEKCVVLNLTACCCGLL